MAIECELSAEIRSTIFPSEQYHVIQYVIDSFAIINAIKYRRYSLNAKTHKLCDGYLEEVSLREREEFAKVPPIAHETLEAANN